MFEALTSVLLVPSTYYYPYTRKRVMVLEGVMILHFDYTSRLQLLNTGIISLYRLPRISLPILPHYPSSF